MLNAVLRRLVAHFFDWLGGQGVLHLTYYYIAIDDQLLLQLLNFQLVIGSSAALLLAVDLVVEETGHPLLIGRGCA